MSNIIECPHCDGEMIEGGNLPGSTVTCPHCHGLLTMPPPTAPPRDRLREASEAINQAGTTVAKLGCAIPVLAGCYFVLKAILGL